MNKYTYMLNIKYIYVYFNILYMYCNVYIKYNNNTKCHIYIHLYGKIYTIYALYSILYKISISICVLQYIIYVL